MVDPVILAIVVVLISALGAALFLLGGKEKKKSTTITAGSDGDKEPATQTVQPSRTAVPSETFSDALNDKPASEVVWEEVEGNLPLAISTRVC